MADMPMKLESAGVSDLPATAEQLARGFIQEPMSAQPTWPMRRNSNGDEYDATLEMDAEYQPKGFLTRPQGSFER